MPIAGVLSWDRCDPEALLGRGLSAAKTHPDEECRVWGSQIQGIAVGVLGRSGLSGPDEFHRLEERDIALATRFPRLLKDQSIYEVVAQADGDKATLWEAVHKASARFGDWYALIGTCGATLVGARDPIGQCPLFFGSTSELHAFSSTRKALWAMGISRPQVFPS